MRKPSGRAILTVLLTLALASGAAARSRATACAKSGRETEAKAAFLLNVLKFVEWPVGSFENPESPIVIGVVGSGPLAASLEQLVTGQNANGRSILVKRIEADADIYGCQMLFFAGVDRRHACDLLREVDKQSILTVGDTGWFSSAGGMIGFPRESGRVVIEINPGSASRSGLHLSPRLLGMARLVNGKQCGERH